MPALRAQTEFGETGLAKRHYDLPREIAMAPAPSMHATRMPMAM
jgi:hypothetical protein